MREPHKDPADPNKQRKGKLMVLLDVVPGEGSGMADLGLEQFLAEFDVIRSSGIPWPSSILRSGLNGFLVITNPKLRGRNPLATLFNVRGTPIAIPMYDVARDQAGAAKAEAGCVPHRRRDVVDDLSRLPGVPDVWEETSVGDAMELLTDHVKKSLATFRTQLKDTLPVGVAVSEPCRQPGRSARGNARQRHAACPGHWRCHLRFQRDD